MTMTETTRRTLLRVGAGLSAVGAASSVFGLQLATMSAASAQSATPDYKALVCVFMLGGNDSNNMLLATDQQSWSRYFAARTTGGDPIALMPPGSAATPIGQISTVTGRTASATSPEAWGGVLPITPNTPNPVPPGTDSSSRTFAIHPFMGDLLPIWQAGRLAMIANVGTLIRPITRAQFANQSVPVPRALMSHNDQQSTWQSGGIEGARVGWGGQMADQLFSANGDNAVFTAISTAGNAVFLAGNNIVQYQVNTNPAMPAIAINGLNGGGGFGSPNLGARLEQLVRDTSNASYFAKDLGARTARSIDSSSDLNGAFATTDVQAVPMPTPLGNPLTGEAQTNPLAMQLATVARAIVAARTLGVRRQVFFVAIGGFDTHNDENGVHPVHMARIAHAFSYFDAALGNVAGVDLRANVTTFTASDFSRTFTQNNDGTDHAWGAHHMVMGGAVRGRDIYGQYPTLGVDQGSFQNPDQVINSFIPTLSVDQYAATLGRWFGISNSALTEIFPNLGNFAAPPNFMNT